jgi:hypothetical protein
MTIHAYTEDQLVEQDVKAYTESNISYLLYEKLLASCGRFIWS